MLIERSQNLSKLILRAPEMTNQIGKLISHLITASEEDLSDIEEKSEEREIPVDIETEEGELESFDGSYSENYKDYNQENLIYH